MRALLLAFALLLLAACRPHAAPALSDWLAAGHAERQFDLAAAADFYRRALEADSGNLKVQRRLLRMRIAAGDVGASLALARRMDKSLSADRPGGEAALDRTLVALRLAVNHINRGDWPAAAARLEGPAGKTLPNAVKLLALAWVRHAAGDASGAEDALSGAGKLREAAGWARLHRALLLHAAGRTEEARGAFERIGRVGAGTRGILAKAAFERTGRAVAGTRGILAEAAFLMAAGDAEGSRRQLQRYRSMGGPLLPGDPARLEPLASTPSEGVAEVFYGVAEELRRRRAALALIYARLAAMLEPDHHAALLLTGDILAGRDRHDEAAAAYRSVPADSIWRLTAQANLARAYASGGRLDEAVALLEAEAAARPDDPFPLGELGHLLRGEERFEEAFRAYDRAIARIEGQAGTEHWRLYYGRGIALERTRRWEPAERDLLKALEFVPDHAHVLNYLGYSWIDRGERYERAEEMVARAAGLRPRDGYIADSLGWVYFRTGRYREAVEELERAAALTPLEPVVNEHLGDAYWKVGRRREARFQWRRALDFDPDPERIEGLRQRLDCGLDCD